MRGILLFFVTLAMCAGIGACGSSLQLQDNNLETGKTSDSDYDKSISTTTIPEIRIDWLPISGTPKYYIKELDWIVIEDSESSREWIYSRNIGKLDAEFDTVCPFSDGMAVVSKYNENWEQGDGASKRKYGFIDNTGSIVIPLEYDHAFDFVDGMACVTKLTSPDASLGLTTTTLGGIIDKTGAYIVPLELGRIVTLHSEGLMSICDDIAEEWPEGLIDKNGKVVVNFPKSAGGYIGISSVGEFSEGLAPFTDRSNSDVKMGYIDTTGTIVIQPNYDNAFPFSEGLAEVSEYSNNDYLNSKYGYIDRNGKIIIPIKYSSGDIGEFFEGMVWVREHDNNYPDDIPQYLYGFIDQDGKTVIPLQYVEVNDFSQGLAAVRTVDYLWGFINKSGEMIISAEYDEAGSFSGGIAPVAIEDSDYFINWGFIDKNGNIVVPLKYENVGTLDDSIGWVENRGQIGIFNLPENDEG